MRQAGDIGALYVLIAILIYTGVYFARSPWRASILTLIFAVKNILVVFLIGQVVASLFLGSDYWGRDWFRIADYYLCGTAYVALAVLLWRMQSHDKAEFMANASQFEADEVEARAEQRARCKGDG